MNAPTLSPDLPPLDACPFCAAGQTQIVENGKVWIGMKYSEPSSVSVRHWCEPVEGQPSRMVERVGRDRASAIAAWNRRASRAGAAVPPDTLKDAERYRYLVGACGFTIAEDLFGITTGKNVIAQLDAAIDENIEAHQRWKK